MLDAPFAIAIIALVVGMAAGSLGVFLVLDSKIQRLQADCRAAARARVIAAVRRG